MKNITIALSLILLTIMLACEKDKDKPTLIDNPVAPIITSPSNNYNLVIEPDDTAEFIYFTWEEADYGVNTSILYELLIDTAGNNLLSAVSLGTASGDTISYSVLDFNDILLNELEIPANEESVLELQLNTSINDTFRTSSEIVTIKVTPFEIILGDLYLFGEFQDWSLNNPSILYVYENIGANLTFFAEGSFERFVYFESATEIKFSNAPDLDNILYGEGSSANTLSTDPSADNITISEAGYYKINVDTALLEYQLLLIESWGIIGDATIGLWDSSTPMNYDPVEDIWTIEDASLVPGNLKFRANDAWNPDYGPLTGLESEFSGPLVRTTGSISISEAGSYTITIDFSQTNDDYEYDGYENMYWYTIVQN
ncbi:MAG: SusE domain-containing protein [Bacteroidales bacterium]|nr:SusE domain-containing protein [Bacteroidales bacterium]